MSREFSPLCPSQEAVFDARVSGSPVAVNAHSRGHDTDMNQYDLEYGPLAMFAAQDSSDSFATPTPTHSISDTTFQTQVILTPPSTSRACSGRADLEAGFEAQGSIMPEFSPGWISGPPRYDYFAESSPGEPVHRSQTDLPDLASFCEFRVIKKFRCSLHLQFPL